MTLLKLAPLSLIAIIFLNCAQFTKIPIRIRSYGWILLHLPRILRKRARIQMMRAVPDRKIVAAMSCILFDPANFSGLVAKLIKAANRISFGYCRLVGLR